MQSVFCAVLFLLMFPHEVGGSHESNCHLTFPPNDHYYQKGDYIIGGIFTVRAWVLKIMATFQSEPFGMNSSCQMINIRNYQNLLAFVFAITEINNNEELLPNNTLGFYITDSCFKEERATMGILEMLSGKTSPVPNYCFRNALSLVGIVNGISSKISLLLARMFSLYKIPQISYSSMDPELSDKIQFPSFYRTVPNEIIQYQAIIKLIQYFGWFWIGILVSDNEPGLKASQFLRKGLTEAGGCAAFVEFIPQREASNDRSLAKLTNILLSSSPDAIILYGDREYMLTLQIILYQFPVLDKVWIISSQWDLTTGLDFYFLTFDSFNGSLAFAIHSTAIPNFESFLLNINPGLYPDDIFVADMWWELFLCIWNEKNFSVNACTGREHLSNSSYPYIREVPIYSYTIYNAVYVLAYALHQMHTQSKMSKDDLNNGQFWKLNKYLKDVRFTNSAGAVVDFDENGDMYSEFDVLNWIVYPNQTINAIKVGRFNPQDSVQPLVIYEDLIRWNPYFNQTPRSACKITCLPGYRKSPRVGQMACCYDCISCPEGEISNQTNMETCFKCPEDKWPNTNKDTCIYKVIMYLSYEEPLGKSLAAVSILLFLLTCLVMAVFTKHRNTPVVRANNQSLSFILLFSLKACFLCTLIFIGHPLQMTCILRQTIFGITFTISVSSILAKTVTVVIAFKATKPNSKLRNWVGARLSNLIVAFCTLVQVVICVLWLGISPPFPYYNTKDEVDKIVAQCNEGSLFGFYCVLGYMGLLAFLSFMIAFQVRNLPDIFNEAKLITFSMLMFCSVWITFIPVYLSTKGKNMVTVEIFAILASSLGLLGCIFIPKCYIILFRPERNTKVFVSIKGNVSQG